MKIKVLVNASTLVIGGGIQIGASFIEYFDKNPSNSFEFFYLVSKEIYKNLSDEIKLRTAIEVIDSSPAKIFLGKQSRKKLIEIESKYKPDIVYSLGFPSYVRFSAIEIGRYTNPWEIFPAKLAWSLLKYKEKILVWMKTQYRIIWAKNIDYYETQTHSAKIAISDTLVVPKEKVQVIPNSINEIFLKNISTKINIDMTSKFNVFCLGAPHIHKNFTCIPKIAKELSKFDIKRPFTFLLTLPEESEIWKDIHKESIQLDVNKFIHNIGPIKLKSCLYWYKSSSMVFIPTVLEVFSATYLEAMAMQKPIMTSDLDFAREICGNAAIYVKPNSYNSIAKEIYCLMNDKLGQEELIINGLNQLKQFPSLNQKYDSLLIWFKEIYNMKSSNK
jgi:glycosyltransferase involved in cell wall biosynthesis